MDYRILSWDDGGKLLSMSWFFISLLGFDSQEKEKNTDDKLFPACIVGKSEFIEFFCDLQLPVDRFTA